MTTVWLSLVLSLALVLGAAAFAALRGIRVFRDVKQLARGVSEELRRIERTAGYIQLHLDEAARSNDALNAATARLAQSRAQLNVLLSAIADVRASIALVTVFAPRK